jgi:predicted transcriptional regulator of viral defense system
MQIMSDASGVEPSNAVEPRMHDPSVAMAALAARQHGVVARRQLAALGLSRHVVGRMLERGRLHVVHRGVYAVGHRRLTRYGVWMAAVLAAGDSAVLSHRSAAALWRIRESDRRTIEVTAPREVLRPRLAVCRSVLRPDEVTVHDGIPVTTPARTLLDLAALLDRHRLARAAERAEALRLASPTSLEDLTNRYPRRPGTPSLKQLIEEGRVVPATTANDFERRFLTFLDANGLPRPLVNESLDPQTTPDFRWPSQGLIVELDGFETHGTRAAFERDRARDRALLAAGWRVARITQRQLDDDPDAVAAELGAILKSATTAAPGPRRGPRTPAPRSRPAGR